MKDLPAKAPMVDAQGVPTIETVIVMQLLLAKVRELETRVYALENP